METPVPPGLPGNIPESTLLPRAFLNRGALIWLWVLPVGVLLLLNLQGYWLVEGNMDPAQRSEALWLGLAGLADLLLGLLFVFLSPQHEGESGTAASRHLFWNLAIVLGQATYLWLATSLIDGLLPASVTAWIYPSDRFLFNQYAFVMLPLFAGIMRIAGTRPAARSGRAFAFNLGLAIGAPVFLYLFFVTLRIFEPVGHLWPLLVAVGLVILGVLMFIALVRAVLLALRRVERWPENGERAAIGLISLILPLGGLLLNRSIPFPVDFQAWEVYALVVVNTAILLLASHQHTRRPRLSFCLLCATFPFSLYFFIVFLPFTPLSILAIIFLGVGFLVLSPTLLLTLHLHLLHKARRNPAFVSSDLGLRVAALLCVLILPAFFTVRGLADKAALNAALDYVYTPAVTSGDCSYSAGLGNLRRALDNHRSYKDGIYYPLLSDYYSWLVFDNLVLPDEKLARLEEVFFGSVGSKDNHDPFRRRVGFMDRGSVRGRSRMPRAGSPPQTVDVGGLQVRAALPGEQQTVLTMALTLENTGLAPSEYRKTLPLPAGLCVSGFRLQIDGHPVAGRIFEKKTALWVYSMIRDSERRDPGLLYYQRPGELELAVFPVNPGRPVVVEIDFLVPAAFSARQLAFQSSDPAVVLGQLRDTLTPQLTADDRGDVMVTGLQSQSLPVVEREPYLHLIIDRSKEHGYEGDLSAAVRILRERFPLARRVRITLANYAVRDLVPVLTPIAQISSQTERDLAHVMPLSGGLVLDLALAHAIREHRETDLDAAPVSGPVPPRPIFVILRGKPDPRQPDLPLTESWANLLPGLELYELTGDGVVASRLGSVATNTPLLRLGRSLRPLVAGAGVSFRNASSADRLEYWSPESSDWQTVAGVARPTADSTWSRAMALQLQQLDYARSPGAPGLDLKSLVRASRESGVLIGSTSYIVVENQAQWRILELSEKQKLNQNAALDFLEAPAPPALYVLLGFGLWLGCRRWRGRRQIGRTHAGT